MLLFCSGGSGQSAAAVDVIQDHYRVPERGGQELGGQELFREPCGLKNVRPGAASLGPSLQMLLIRTCAFTHTALTVTP